MSQDVAALVEEVRALVEERRQIIALLENRSRPVTGLTRADRDVLARLLPVIAATYGSERLRVAMWRKTVRLDCAWWSSRCP